VAAGLPISDVILKEKELEFTRILNIEDKLKCANGWIYKFKLRNVLQKFNFSGEANSAPLNTLPEERTKLHMILNEYSYDDIYNADETELFFRMEPNQTLSTEAIVGRKKDKSKVSVLFCANAS
ncbi:6368_t:CDS:2, partial [Diversispora eburnea]